MRQRSMIGQRRLRSLAVLVALSLPLPACDSAPPDQSAEPLSETLRLIEAWIEPGYYDTRAQAAADAANEVPDELRHREMHQLFAPVRIAGLDGLTYFQQGSSDGTIETTFRAGILQYFIDPEAGAVRQRELNFKEPQRWVEAWRDPARLADFDMDAVVWDPGCDFFLSANPARTEVRGRIRDGACVLPAERMGIELYADDEVVIRPGEFWFLGRYVDAAGKVMWGTENDELNKLRLTKPLAARDRHPSP